MGFFFTALVTLVSIPLKVYTWFNKNFLQMDITGNGAVLVTGCDSGFGHLLAIRLVKKGVNTFACCLTEAGEEKLRKMAASGPGKLWTIRMDVTSDASVQKALDFVKEKIGNGKGLWGVVNNAGTIGCPVPDDWLTVDDYQKPLDINFLGVVRVTHAFKPLLKVNRGRLVVVTSCYGRIAPEGATYCPSKYAAEAYCDVIRRELKPFGVSVHILEPGCFATSITDPEPVARLKREVWERQPPHVKQQYGEAYLEKSFASLREAASYRSPNVHLVVDAFYDALASRFPWDRYCVGMDALLVFMPASLLPARVQDWYLWLLMPGHAM